MSDAHIEAPKYALGDRVEQYSDPALSYGERHSVVGLRFDRREAEWVYEVAKTDGLRSTPIKIDEVVEYDLRKADA